MKVARYQKQSGELYCEFNLSADEYTHLGAPDRVRLSFNGMSTGGACMIVARADGRNDAWCFDVKPKHNTDGPSQFYFRVKRNLFPGTKVFGVEVLDTYVDQQNGRPHVVVPDGPRMHVPVMKRNYKNKAKSAKTMPDADIGELVRALNDRRKGDKGLEFDVDDDGYLLVRREWR